MKPWLSIVIPLHNEEHRMREAVLKAIQWGEHNLLGRYEILLMENGSTDDTYSVACEFDSVYSTVRAHHLIERSKAKAISYGMRSAIGEWRYMCDVDLSTPIQELTSFFKHRQDGYDIIIGSREHRDSRVETSFKRWLIGRIFHLLTLTFTGINFSDTQCGFKLFNAHAADEIFSRVECTSMAFDVEALYLAQVLGYYVTEIPVTWNNDKDSRVRLFRDSWMMFIDLLKIKKIHSKLKPLHNEKVPA